MSHSIHLWKKMIKPEKSSNINSWNHTTMLSVCLLTVNLVAFNPSTSSIPLDPLLTPLPILFTLSLVTCIRLIPLYLITPNYHFTVFFSSANITHIILQLLSSFLSSFSLGQFIHILFSFVQYMYVPFISHIPPPPLPPHYVLVHSICMHAWLNTQMCINWKCSCLGWFNSKLVFFPEDICTDLCMNGATCVPLGTTGASCICASGFTGFQCDTSGWHQTLVNSIAWWKKWLNCNF